MHIISTICLFLLHYLIWKCNLRHSQDRKNMNLQTDSLCSVLSLFVLWWYIHHHCSKNELYIVWNLISTSCAKHTLVVSVERASGEKYSSAFFWAPEEHRSCIILRLVPEFWACMEAQLQDSREMFTLKGKSAHECSSKVESKLVGFFLQ